MMGIRSLIKIISSSDEEIQDKIKKSIQNSFDVESYVFNIQETKKMVTYTFDWNSNGEEYELIVMDYNKKSIYDADLFVNDRKKVSVEANTEEDLLQKLDSHFKKIE